MSNTALLWNAFNEHSSVFTSLGLCRDFSEPELVPIQLPHLQYKVGKKGKDSINMIIHVSLIVG